MAKSMPRPVDGASSQALVESAEGVEVERLREVTSGQIAGQIAGNTGPQLNQQLISLMAIARQHPKGSLPYQKTLTQMIVLIQQSRQLWRGYGADSEVYEEALQQTWLFFCRNFHLYDPAKATVITWLNQHLKYRLLDLKTTAAQERDRRAPPERAPDGNLSDPLDRVVSPPPPPPILEEIQTWLEQQQHKFRRIYVRGRPEANCYCLLLYRLPPARRWEAIAEELEIPVTTLNNFYQRECLPRLRQFLEDQGYG